MSLFSALQVELDRAHTQVDQLIQEQKLDHNEISCLKKRFLEERSAWNVKVHEKIRTSIHSVMEELESEKKLKRRAERLNKKLGLELVTTRATLSKAVKELESERKSREILEQVCNKVVRGVGEDKTEVEHLKKQSAKIRAELEKEREMLHIADEWREERVQMKLLEAKVQFEEKNAAVDRLRNELEAFLENKRTNEETGEGGDDERESADSDLHTIELNMESSSKGYSWSYGVTKSEDNSTSTLAEEKSRKIDQDAERYVSVKKLRDRMLSGARIVPPRGLASPTRQWNRSQSVHDTGDRVCEGLKVAEIVKAIKEGGSKARLSNSSASTH